MISLFANMYYEEISLDTRAVCKEVEVMPNAPNALCQPPACCRLSAVVRQRSTCGTWRSGKFYLAFPPNEALWSVKKKKAFPAFPALHIITCRFYVGPQKGNVVRSILEYMVYVVPIGQATSSHSAPIQPFFYRPFQTKR